MTIRTIFVQFAFAAFLASIALFPSAANAQSSLDDPEIGSLSAMVWDDDDDDDDDDRKRRHRGRGDWGRSDAYWLQREYDNRQKHKNEWRNLAIAAGAISIIGLLNKDSTLTFAGAAGALYSAYRYEQDRKSQNRLNRARAYYFGRGWFERDGRRYERRTVWKGGKKHYRFVRC